MKKMLKNQLLAFLTLSFLIAAVFYATYSWFTTFYAVQNIIGNLYYEFNAVVYESTENIEMLEKAQPMGNSEAITKIDPHIFIIENNNDFLIEYFVIVKDITPPPTEQEYENYRITPQSIHFMVDIDDRGQYQLGALTPSANKRHMIYRGTLDANEEATVSIRLYLGPGTVVDGAATYTDEETLERFYRYFKALVVVEAN